MQLKYLCNFDSISINNLRFFVGGLSQKICIYCLKVILKETKGFLLTNFFIEVTTQNLSYQKCLRCVNKGKAYFSHIS